jgi:hypothetical protein
MAKGEPRVTNAAAASTMHYYCCCCLLLPLLVASNTNDAASPCCFCSCCCSLLVMMMMMLLKKHGNSRHVKPGSHSQKNIVLDRWKLIFSRGMHVRKIQIQDLKLWSQLSPQDQVLAMIQRHQSIRHICISLSIHYLYSLTEGY